MFLKIRLRRGDGADRSPVACGCGEDKEERYGSGWDKEMKGEKKKKKDTSPIHVLTSTEEI